MIERVGSADEDPDVAFDGTNFIVVWEHIGDIWARRVSREGVVLDSDAIVVCAEQSGQEAPAVCFDGTDYLVAWGDFRNSTYHTDLYAARVTPEGTVLDPDGIPISTAPGHQTSPGIAHDGSVWLVAWSDWRAELQDIYVSRVDASGRVLDTAGIPVTLDSVRQYEPSVAFGGDYFLVAWTIRRPDRGTDVYTSRVNRQGRVMDPGGLPVTSNTYSSGGTDVSYDGYNYLVSFGGRRYQTYAARVEQSGHCLDPDGFLVSISPGGGGATAVSFDGTDYFVAWDHYSSLRYDDVFAARVNVWGEVIDSVGILVSTAVFHEDWPAVSWDGSSYLVAWQDYREGKQCDVYAARVDGEGAVLDPVPFAVSTAPLRQWYPNVAYSAPYHLVAWNDGRDSLYNAWAARVDRNGHVLDPAGIRVTSDRAWRPAVAGGSGQYLIVWSDWRDARAARMDTGGRVLDPMGLDIRTVPTVVGEPAVAAGDSGYMVVWADDRRSDTLSELDVFAARVTPSGEVLDPGGFPVAIADTLAEVDAAVAFGVDSYLVAWMSHGPDSFWIEAVRVSRRGVVLDTLPIVLSTDYGTHLTACYDGTDYLVAWEFGGGLRGARVSTDGVLLDTFPVARLQGVQALPSLAGNGSGQALAAFVSPADSIRGAPVRVNRIWANLTPFVGMRGSAPGILRARRGAMLVRGMLPLTGNRGADLVDITGRRIMELQPGANDVRHLSPGVYFVTPHPGPRAQRPASPSPQGERGKESAVRKVVVQR
ncbi:MAG: hypothetical protein JSU73_11035 [candidate division WOR-3 bacterium]|nr:MAG: hypothetical protein JSU73_11035 [candidate division WOR-3 bacterium]